MKRIKTCTIKLLLTLIIILMLLVLAFFLIQKNVKQFDEKRTALVDKIENNYVFRGNNPFIIRDGKTVFAYDDLTASFNKKLKEAGDKPLNDYYLIDISLLDLDQYYTIEKEKEFFASRHEIGEVINFSTLSPTLLFGKFSHAKIVRNSINNYNLWVTERLEKIHELASKKIDKPVVVYIHCDSGRDRTGLMISGYRLLFNNAKLEKIRDMDLKEVGRSSVFSYDQAIRSYCDYVRKNYNKPEDYCTYVYKPH